ncbi:MAG: energy transducer TonB, partial [Candidatus Acidiferrales bacterium]
SFFEAVERKVFAFFFAYDLDSDSEPLPDSSAPPEFGALSVPDAGPALAVRIQELRDELRVMWRELRLAPRRALLSLLLGPGWDAPVEAAEETQLHTVQLTRGLTGRSLTVSIGLHVAFLATPLPVFLALPGQRPAAEMVKIENDLQWIPTSRVLPPIMPKRSASKRPSPGGKPNQPLPPLGAESKQRQAIVSTPPKPNHPTQTLIQQFALDKARVDIRVRVPNMVTPPGPAPTPEIDLRRLRIPDAPVDLSGPSQAPALPKPKSRAELALREKRLENLLARLTVPAARSATGAGADDAPDISAPLGPARSGDLVPHGVLALSANPDASGPVLHLPDANLRARIVSGPYSGAGSPGGVPGGVPGAEGGSGGGPGGIAGGSGGGLFAPDIFVAPAGNVPAGPIIVGPGGQTGTGGPPPPPPPAPRQVARNNPGGSGARTQAQKSPEQRARELLAALHPGAQSPSEGARRQVFMTYLYLAALTSQSSSWMLQYSEFPGSTPEGVPADAPVIAPQVVKKVDPCYSADAHWERVEGTVLLYAVIRTDGGVGDIVVMRSLAQKIDERAIAALQNSRFEAARKGGRPVHVEALVEIPFRLAPCM